MKETYMQFKKRIAEEGFEIRRNFSHNYTITVPDGRRFSGTLTEIKDWIGE